jgi:hypothetical protein
MSGGYIGHSQGAQFAPVNSSTNFSDRFSDEPFECLSETDPLPLATAQFVWVLLGHRLGGLETDGFRIHT